MTGLEALDALATGQYDRHIIRCFEEFEKRDDYIVSISAQFPDAINNRFIGELNKDELWTDNWNDETLFGKKCLFGVDGQGSFDYKIDIITNRESRTWSYYLFYLVDGEYGGYIPVRHKGKELLTTEGDLDRKSKEVILRYIERVLDGADIFYSNYLTDYTLLMILLYMGWESATVKCTLRSFGKQHENYRLEMIPVITTMFL